MIFGVEGVDAARRARLIRLLDIDLYQRLSTMSDGQRRRVQICMGLLRPYEVGGSCLQVGVQRLHFHSWVPGWCRVV